MGRHEKKPSKKKVKIEWSKLVCLLTILAGLLIVQECLFLMYLCIKGGYTFEAAKAKDFTEDEDKNSPPI